MKLSTPKGKNTNPQLLKTICGTVLAASVAFSQLNAPVFANTENAIMATATENNE